MDTMFAGGRLEDGVRINEAEYFIYLSSEDRVLLQKKADKFLEKGHMLQHTSSDGTKMVLTQLRAVESWNKKGPTMMKYRDLNDNVREINIETAIKDIENKLNEIRKLSQQDIVSRYDAECIAKTFYSLNDLILEFNLSLLYWVATR